VFQGLSKLKKEIEEFEREKASELRRIDEVRSEEMKKLKYVAFQLFRLCPWDKKWPCFRRQKFT